MQFHITGLREGGRGKDELSKHEGFANWDVHFHQDDYHEVLDKDSIVYLSSESENVVDALEPGINYVIGGLVDHNNHKGLCHRCQVAIGAQVEQSRVSKMFSGLGGGLLRGARGGGDLAEGREGGTCS